MLFFKKNFVWAIQFNPIQTGARGEGGWAFEAHLNFYAITTNFC